MVNWCPNCHTAISDAEVEYKEEESHLWHLRYKVKDEERYKDLVGKTVIVPIVNREIPVIADEFVEKEFGTGCVNETPFDTQSSEMLENREVV